MEKHRGSKIRISLESLRKEIIDIWERYIDKRKAVDNLRKDHEVLFEINQKISIQVQNNLEKINTYKKNQKELLSLLNDLLSGKIIELSEGHANNSNRIEILQKNHQNLLEMNQKISAQVQNNLASVNIYENNQKNMLTLMNELSSYMVEKDYIISKLYDYLNDSILNQRDLLESKYHFKMKDINLKSSEPQMKKTLNLKESFIEFKKRFPKVWRLYKDALEKGTDSYRDFPKDSCSTDRHPKAKKFGKFIFPYLRGHVLDVGCGPQSIPIYLKNYPVEYIHGIDPISTASDHPFDFVSGVGEFLPWKDEQFEVVISGTTLDHYFLLELGLQEVWRVLKKGGHFIAWITHFEGSPAYNPEDDQFEPADEEHLYHIDRKWFDPMMTKLNFTLKEEITYMHPFKYLFLVYGKN